METIMVVVVVVILLVIGLVIYYNVSSGSVEDAANRISEVKTSVLVNIIDSMPEIQCSIRASPKDCVDVIKLQALKKTVDSNRIFYSDLFGFKVIRFEQVYPIPDRVTGNGECTFASFQNPDYPRTCANWTVYSHPKPNFNHKDIVKVPVSLYHSLDGRYALGILFLEVYS